MRAQPDRLPGVRGEKGVKLTPVIVISGGDDEGDTRLGAPILDRLDPFPSRMPGPDTEISEVEHRFDTGAGQARNSALNPNKTSVPIAGDADPRIRGVPKIFDELPMRGVGQSVSPA